MLQNVTDDIATTADVEALEPALARVALAPDGTILRTNAAFLEMFDYRAWDLSGRTRKVFLSDTPDLTVESAVSRVFEEGVALHTEVTRIKRDGSELLLDAIFHPVKDPFGVLQEVIVLLRDISEQKRRCDRQCDLSRDR